MAKKKKQEIPITPQMQADFNRYSQILSDTPITPNGVNPLAPQQQNTSNFNFNLTLDDLKRIEANSKQQKNNEIPSLQQTMQSEYKRMEQAKADTTTPRTEGEQKAIDTYYNGLKEALNQKPQTPDYKSEIERMRAMKADTTAQRTPGENQAIDTYLASLEEAQRVIDSQKKVSQNVPQKKNVSQKKEVLQQNNVQKKDNADELLGAIKDTQNVKDAINSREAEMKKAYNKQQLKNAQLSREDAIQSAYNREQLRRGNIRNVGKDLTQEEQAYLFARYGANVPDLREYDKENPMDKSESITQSKAPSSYLNDYYQPREEKAKEEKNKIIDAENRRRQELIDYNDKLAYAISQGFNPSQMGFKDNSPELMSYINRRYEDYKPDKNSEEYKQNVYYPYLQNKLNNGEVLTPDEEADYGRSMMTSLTPEEKRAMDYQQQRIYDWQYMNILSNNAENKELRDTYLSNGRTPFNPEQDSNWATRLKALDPEKWDDETIEEYRKAMYKIANQEATNDYVSRYDMTTEERNNFLQGLDNTIESLNPVRTVAAPLIGAIDNTFGGNTDVYAPSQSGQYASEYARGQVSNSLNNKYGNVASGAYNIAMSTADTIERTALGKALGTDALTLMIGSSQAFNSTYKDARERGLSNSQAKGEAALSAIVEWGTEKVPLERLSDVFRAMPKSDWDAAAVEILKQAGCEGSEEAISDIANRIVDYFVASKDGKDAYTQSIEAYMAQGMNRQKAEQLASADFWKETGVDFLGGAVSGGLLGYGTTKLGKIYGNSPESYAYQTFLEQKSAKDLLPYLETLKVNNGGYVNLGANNQVNNNINNEQNNNSNNIPIVEQNNAINSLINNVNSAQVVENNTQEQVIKNNERLAELNQEIPKVQEMVDNSKTTDEKAFLQQNLDEMVEEARTIELSNNESQSILDNLQKTINENPYNLSEEALNNIAKRNEVYTNKLMPENAGLEVPSNATLTESIPQNINPNEDIVTPEMVMDNVPKDVKTDIGNTRTITNTGRKTGFISQEELLNNPEIKSMAAHAIAHEETSMKTALDRVSEDAIEWENKYINEKATIDNNEDVDTIMCLISDIKRQEKAALDNGNTQLANQLMARRTALFDKASKDLTRHGEIIQALAKWSRTAEGAELCARNIKAQEGKKYTDRNVEDKKKINALAEKLATNKTINRALNELGNENVKAANKVVPTVKPHETIVEEIKNSISQDERFANANLTDENYEYIASLVENKVPNWQIVNELQHLLQHGDFAYIKADNVEQNLATNSKINAVLRHMGYDNTQKKPLVKKNHNQIKDEIKRSFEREFSSIDNFTDTDFEFLTSLVENKIPNWQIEDEISHKLSTGTWYTLDESTPIKVKTSKKLDGILNGIGKDKSIIPKVETPKTHTEIINEIKNSFANESSDISDKFNDSDYEFIATMFEEKVSKQEIQNEIEHKLLYGNWYTLDESTHIAQKQNSTLRSAINQLAKPDVQQQNEIVKPSHKEILNEVKATIDNETSSLFNNFDDNDIELLANFIESGATSNDISEMIATKIATGSMGFTPETIAKVNQLFDEAQNYDANSKQRNQIEMQAFKLLANEIGAKATLKEKFDAWRYLAMLGNPKTHIRNMTGNAMFQGVTDTSNTLAAIMEIGVDAASNGVGKLTNGKIGGGIERTKTLFNPFNKGDYSLISSAWKDAVDKNYTALSGNKYGNNVKHDIMSQMETFFLKNPQKALEINGKLLDAEDFIAMRKKYSTSLAMYLKANGYDSSIFDDEYKYEYALKDNTRLNNDEVEMLKQRVDFLNKAREYAVKQAEYSAFHEDNVIADKLSKHSRDYAESNNPFANVASDVIEGTVPFKKTPMNIGRSMVEYSPLNIIQDAYLTAKKIKGIDKNARLLRKNGNDFKPGGEVKAADIIESMSKTLTGTGLIWLGVSLASKGLLNVSKDDEYYQDQTEGHPNYSLSIPINGKTITFTIDSLAPSCAPLLIGATLQNIAEENGVGDEDLITKLDSINLEDAANTAFSLANPIMETSMLSGLEDTLESVANATRTYGNDNTGKSAIGTLVANTFLGYALQAVPTSFGQLARTIDPTRRSTYVQSEGFMGGLYKPIQKKLNATPLISMLQEPYINTRGETESNGIVNSGNNVIDFLGNLAYNSLSPFYIDEVNQTDADKMARDVYANMSDPTSDVFSHYFTSKKIDGERVSPEDYTTYMKAAQGVDNRIREALSFNEDFLNLPADNQAKILESIKNLADKVGEAKINPEFSTDDKAYAAFMRGDVDGVVDYYVNNSKKDIDKNNVSEYAGIPNDKVQDWHIDIYNEGTDEEKKKLADFNYISTQMTGHQLYKDDWDKYKDKSNEDYVKHLKESADNARKKENAKAEYDEKMQDKSSVVSQLASYGLEDNPEKPFRETLYNNAKQVIPSLSVEQYANTFNAIDSMVDAANGSIKRDEMIAYLNKINASEEEGQKLWKAYGGWKSIPYLKAGKWKVK